MEFLDLVQQPEARRDESWETEFLQHFTEQKVQVVEDMAKPGPDGWPYLHVRTSPDGSETAVQVIQWLAGRGIGLVVNAHKMLPDYVFTYGMLWNFVETGRFISPTAPQSAGPVTLGADRLMGPPTDKYLPPYVREVLREFLVAQGYPEVKILVVSNADFSEVDLAVSTASLRQLPQSEHKTMAEMLSWFLPLHYRLVLSESQDLPWVAL